MAGAGTEVTLRDIADGWHLCVVAGLASPAAATISDSLAGLLALLAVFHGHRRPAVTLTATTCASLLASTLIH